MRPSAGSDHFHSVLISSIHSQPSVYTLLPPRAASDFLKGVTYKETDDPLLRKIYDKECDTGGDEEDANVVKNWKEVDPRQELFAAIKGRRTDM